MIRTFLVASVAATVLAAAPSSFAQGRAGGAGSQEAAARPRPLPSIRVRAHRVRKVKRTSPRSNPCRFTSVDRDTKRSEIFRLAGSHYLAVQPDPDGWLTSATLDVRFTSDAGARLIVEDRRDPATRAEI